MIKVFIYSKETGVLIYADTGLPDDIFRDLPTDADFTLTPPPNTHERWLWTDNKWVADNTAS